MFSKFFIDRPIFATVISIVIILLGGAAVPLLPIEKTPDITPPTVSVRASYPGADAKTIADTVATPLEQQINGVDNMLYMSSSSSDDGSMSITVSFEIGTDIDMAAVMVQNRVSLAVPQLPEEVTRLGVSVQKRSTNFVMVVNLVSPEKSYDTLFMSNYINTQIKDVLLRVDGVGDVMVFGAKDFGMRLWLDPEKLKARNLSTQDIINVIREQNVQVAAGQIGAPPVTNDLQFQYSVKASGRLKDPVEFENIIVKVQDSRILRLKDVARVELGSQSYSSYSELDGNPCVSIGVFQLPGANGLDISTSIHDQMEAMSADFPEDMEYRIAYDATKFITKSLEEVIQTLLITVVLVVLITFVFLEDFRATLIPAITIPVSLIGTFAVMYAMGMSINTLTLFGLVLVIGIVVDDAIVVVENAMRIIEEEKLPAKQAAVKAMEQITGPVIATTLVLLAVFVPTAMVGGVIGRLYSQFALTISIATVFSSINALTLSPALCGILLKPIDIEKRNIFFRTFNRFFKSMTNGYMSIVNVLVRKTFYAMVFFVAICIVTATGFKSLPTGFLPGEDEGFFMAQVMLPEGASLTRTKDTMNKVNEILQNTPGVDHFITIGGFSIFDNVNASSRATIIGILDPWEDRMSPELHVNTILKELTPKMMMLGDGFGFAVAPPPIPGLGFGAGYEIQLQDRASLGSAFLQQAGESIVYSTMNEPKLKMANASFKANVPQLFVEVNKIKAKTLDVPLTNIYDSLQTYLGSLYVNDFNIFGRTFKVTAQADAEFRSQIEDILKLEVRNSNGAMVPLETLLEVSETVGPQTITHFNLFPSNMIMGEAVTGVSTGQAMETIAEIADQNLPSGIDFVWSGLSFQQSQAGSKQVFIFLFASIFVFLFLAAQYESWSIPIAIILSVPLALFGAVVSIWLRGFDNNTYTQIGLVLLIGLASKTSILLVEFAKQYHENGHSILESAIVASRLRFRPILMTALSFVLGVVPLVIATGAGAVARQALGTAVFGGMLMATILGVFLLPVFYVVIQKFTEKTIELEHKLEDKIHHKPAE